MNARLNVCLVSIAAFCIRSFAVDFPECPGVPGLPYHRYRMVQGHSYDLQPIYEWLKILHKPANRVTERERISRRPMQEWRTYASTYYDGHEFYEVSEVLAEGIIIEPQIAFGDRVSYGNEFLLVNYPWQDKTMVGKRLRFVALKAGVFQHDGRTLQIYDYGIPCEPPLKNSDLKR